IDHARPVIDPPHLREDNGFRLVARFLRQESAEHHALPDLRAAPQDLDFLVKELFLFASIQQQKVLAVEPEFLPEVPYFSPGGIGWNVAPVHGVEQSEQSDFLTLRFQLLRHLVGDSTAQAVAAQMIRAMRLDAADLPHVERRHLLDRCQAWTFAVEAPWMQKNGGREPLGWIATSGDQSGDVLSVCRSFANCAMV